MLACVVNREKEIPSTINSSHRLSSPPNPVQSQQTILTVKVYIIHESITVHKLDNVVCTSVVWLLYKILVILCINKVSFIVTATSICTNTAGHHSWWVWYKPLINLLSCWLITSIWVCTHTHTHTHAHTCTHTHKHTHTHSSSNHQWWAYQTMIQVGEELAFS